MKLNWDKEKQLVKKDFDLLIEKGNLGFYNSCEITTIFLYDNNLRKAKNFYTIAVFEERERSDTNESTFITDKPVSINKKYRLGIIRYQKSIEELEKDFTTLLKENRWSYNGDDLIIGNLKPLPKQFIPTDSTVIIPLNSVLKNNFYNGSYILEFFDQEKEELRDVLESEKLLDKICTCIRGFLPIDLLYIRDRIGNIIFQFPSRMLALDAKSLSTWEGIEAQIAWHPLFNNLDQISIQTSGHFDKNIMGFCQLDKINHHSNELYSGNSNHMNSTIVFNKENGLILSSFSASFIRHIHMTTDVSKPYQEPRTIKLFDEENNLVDTIEVPIVYRVGKQKAHDRFIIFPFKNGKPRAWSLGTSINSFGEKHHILQEVSNARMILDAFMELWEELQDPKCLVWRSK